MVSDSRSQSSAAATTGSPEAVRHLPRSSCVTAYPSTTAPRVVCRAIRRTGPGQTNPGGFMATTTTPSEGGLPDPRTRHPNHDQRCPLHPRAGPTAIVLKRRRPAPADHTAPPFRVVLPAFGADQGRFHSSLLGTTRHRLERGVRKPVTRRCPAEAPVTTHSRPRTAEVADPATTDRAGIEMPHGSRARITPHCGWYADRKRASVAGVHQLTPVRRAAASAGQHFLGIGPVRVTHPCGAARELRVR